MGCVCGGRGEGYRVCVNNKEYRKMVGGKYSIRSDTLEYEPLSSASEAWM